MNVRREPIVLLLLLAVLLLTACGGGEIPADAGGGGVVPIDDAPVPDDPGASAQWPYLAGGGELDLAYSVTTTEDGGYVIVGEHWTGSDDGFTADSDILLSKISDGGEELWSTILGNALNEMPFTPLSSMDFASYVRQTPDGGFILVGSTASTFGSAGVILLVKTDAAGNQEWTKVFSDESGAGFAYAVEPVTGGGYVVAGYRQLYDTGLKQMFLLKTDADGNELWTNYYSGLGSAAAYSVQQTSDTGFVLAGETGLTADGSGDICLLKTNAGGNQVWFKTFGGDGDDFAMAVVQAADGGYVMAGQTMAAGSSDRDIILMKADASGSQLWQETVGGSGEEMAYDMKVTADGGFALAGYTKSFGEGGKDMYLVKSDAAGNILWSQAYGGAADDLALSLAIAPDGGFVLAGGSKSFGAGEMQVYLVRTSPQGVKE